ncbi:MAG: hypothetical protein DRP64_03375 [Verrucomicrobia bacterium]|nr:MAG: hypothetical protein DRP64_03375 [Verrucomicrobiota bacterium]
MQDGEDVQKGSFEFKPVGWNFMMRQIMSRIMRGAGLPWSLLHNITEEYYIIIRGQESINARWYVSYSFSRIDLEDHRFFCSATEKISAKARE